MGRAAGPDALLVMSRDADARGYAAPIGIDDPTSAPVLGGGPLPSSGVSSSLAREGSSERGRGWCSGASRERARGTRRGGLGGSPGARPPGGTNTTDPDPPRGRGPDPLRGRDANSLPEPEIRLGGS
ncbi:MAG: hypothetical protein M0Z95_14395 [Actinomycetota bacterium]|nr:hypothetical protein [Actinomycetota bacterium]